VILRRTTILFALALCVAASGCGSGASQSLSRSEYLQRLREIEAGPPARAADRLFFELVTEPGLAKEACSAAAQHFYESAGQVVRSVASLKPPRDVALLQRRFVSAARQSVAELGRAASDATAGSLRCGTPMNKRIYGMPSTRRMEQVLTELRVKGYILGSNSD
jgi:hypothetical protein